MHHVRGGGAGRTSSADDSKGSPGSFGTVQSRNTVQNKTHFRTIAPKVAPKIVSSCASSFAPVMADISASGTKPFVVQPQNYALMKVAGQDGTFSLVALPNVTSSMGGPVIQSTGIPLQENLKLPIPRYQSSREKKLLNKKSGMHNKPRVENPTVKKTHDTMTKIKEEPKEDPATLKCHFQANTDEVVPESSIPCEAKAINIHNPPLICVNKVACLSATTSPNTFNNDHKMTIVAQDNESLVKCESAKVFESTNPAAVPSQVLFGSPVHILSPAPNGKVPIMPYSKIKRSIISNCTQLSCFTRPTPSIVDKVGKQAPSSEVQTASSSVSELKDSIPDNQNQSIEFGVASIKNNLVSSKRRGKKRKPSSEISRYQTKMRLLGNRLIKSQAVEEGSDKNLLATKKYRNIMPKPCVDIRGLVSLGGSSSLAQAHTWESAFRNRMMIKTYKWRQSDAVSVARNDCKKPTLAPKVFYKCPICDHSFQFKHHLKDHLNSHSNNRPYHCRLCRKAYVHSGSLSTHMKLQHSDSRLKKMMCCEFCAKVFGHIRVYFGHLKEVHQVIISTELSTMKVEKKELSHSDELGSLDRDKNGKSVDASHRQMDDVRLQIICGRCPFIASTFLDMKVHLLCAHGDKFPETVQDGVLENQQGAQEVMVKHAAHQCNLLRDKPNVLRNSNGEGTQSGPSIADPAHSNETVSAVLVEGKEPLGLPSGFCTKVRFCSGNVFNCLLCKHVFKQQSELIEHWEKKHNCEDPLMLWDIFCSFAKDDKKS